MTTAIDGALALIILLLVTQMWLLSATLDNYLAGHAESALAGAVISGVLFLACGALYLLVMRLERRRRSARPSTFSPPQNQRIDGIR